MKKEREREKKETKREREKEIEKERERQKDRKRKRERKKKRPLHQQKILTLVLEILGPDGFKLPFFTVLNKYFFFANF